MLKNLFHDLWAIFTLNSGALATMSLVEIEIVVKIVLGIVTIVCTVLITAKKLRKR